MSNTFSGSLQAGKNWKIAMVASRFNELITAKLVDGARDGLQRLGASSNNIDLYWTPGAFEIPALASQIIKGGKYSGIICLGAVIRGSTPHFDYVAGETSRGIAALARESEIPVIFSVLTTDTIEQALERAGTKAGNKGFDGAMALVEMISLYEQLK